MNLYYRLSIAFLSVLFLSLPSCNALKKSNELNTDIILKDGLYFIERSDTKKSNLFPLKINEKIISFNKEFIEKTDQNKLFLVVNINDYAPLELAEKPKTEQQEDQRKMLLLKLSDEAKEKLTVFTTKHLNEYAAMVVENEALTKHVIRSVIDGGYLQITRCTDNACEMLYTELQDNVVNEK